MKRITALLAIFLVALLAWPLPGQAQRVSQLPGHGGSLPSATTPFAPPPQVAPPMLGARIVAVVNDSVITSTDVNARMGMAFLASGLTDTPEVRARLIVQILRTMIDEQLELQEAKKLDISVAQDEIDKTLEKIAQENNIPGGDMKAYLSARGIPPDALINQIRAGLSWSKVIQRELRPRVDVGDDEVDAAIERTRANAGKQEYLVSEIFLSVDNPKDEDQVKQFADNLVQQLRTGGNFGAMARQFSQGTGAANGGDIGWIEQGQLATELDRALAALKPDEVSEPIRSASGYHILGLRDKRTIMMGGEAADITAELQQAFRPFGPGIDKAALRAEAEKLRTAISGCQNLQSRLATQFPAWHWQDLGTVKLATAPAWLADKARELPIGKPSEAMGANNGALILFVCDRKSPDGKIDRDAVANQIGNEKLELQARGLLRDLRRNAYLDVRLGQPSG
jgi:peptidyl-prolyl cis-trans isomerase SurA